MKNKPKNKKLLAVIVGVVMIAVIVVAAVWYIDYIRFITTEDARVASNNVHISAKIPGKIVKILVKEGDLVTPNQVLAQIDTTDLLIALAQAKANLEMAKVKNNEAQKAAPEHGKDQQELNIAKNRLDIAKIVLDRANQELKRLKKLFDAHCIPETDLQKATDSAGTAEKNYQVALETVNLLRDTKSNDAKKTQIALSQAKSALESAQFNYDNALIRSAGYGKIALKSVNPGEFISPGQTLFTLIDSNDAWIQANIKETDISYIKVGRDAVIKLDAYPGKSFKGKVYEVGVATNSNFSLLPMSNSSGTFVKVVQNIAVKIRLLDKPPFLQTGMSAIVKIKK